MDQFTKKVIKRFADVIEKGHILSIHKKEQNIWLFHVCIHIKGNLIKSNASSVGDNIIFLFRISKNLSG